MENKNNYKTIIFKIDNQNQFNEIQNKLFNLGYYWYVGKNNRILMKHHFPVCLFIETYKFELSYSNSYIIDDYIDQNDKLGFNNYIKYLNKEPHENICPIIFDYHDLNDLEFIIKNQHRKPTYNPKIKNKRILENKLNEDYIDIKTNDELIEFITSQNIKKPLFNIGDIIKMKDNVIELYDNSNMDSDVYRKFLLNNQHKTFKILELSYGQDNKKWYYRINDNKWIYENFIILNQPNYKPKSKINRIYEEMLMDNEANFRVWCDTTKKAKEFEKYLYFKLGWRWNYMDEDMVEHRATIHTPCTFIFYLNTKKFDCFERYTNETNEIYEYPKDINIINSYLIKKPNYRSKSKIERTFESTNNIKYRFKTKEEFIKQYGESWRQSAADFECDFVQDMDYLLGTRLEYDFPDDVDEIQIPKRNGLYTWYIHKNFLIHKPSYNPRKKIKRVLESTVLHYKSAMIPVMIDNIDEYNKFVENLNKSYGMIFTFYDKIFNPDRPNRVLIINKDLNNNSLKKNTFYQCDNNFILSDQIHRDYDDKCFVHEPVNSKNFSEFENILYSYKILPKNPSAYYMYNPKNSVKRILESIQNETDSLYIFDLDDTLVYSDRFEDKVKHIISENIKPEDILKTEVSKLGINLKDLKYENGRIYLQDDNNEINIPDSSSWIRKKNRIYLIQPDSYYMTDESMPIGIYDKIVNLYNSVDNKMILTARKEKLRDKVIKILNKFNIDIPNNGLYMYPIKTDIFASRWKAEKILEISKNNKFNKIYYFDDNIKQIKKIKKILSKYNINIYFYRVNKNTYRLEE